MHFLIVAEPQAEFDAWEKAQLQTAATPAGGSAADGFALFQKSICANCHAINGAMAPADPQRVKPGVRMPDFKFTDEQITQIVDYLETLK